ncbi:MAG: sulfotransferase domain-containing protein [Candidatus Paceibacteria bacterium]
MSYKNPNFFVIGGPKCGTTSFCRYLCDHPNVYIPTIKEPWFFASDFHNLTRSVTSKREYKSLFDNASNYRAVGEGSTIYLYSNVAIEKILRFNPDSKFIVLFRKPEDMVYSWHSEVFNGKVSNFEQVIGMSYRSRVKEFVPRVNVEEKMFDYEGICRLGNQVSNLIDIIDEDKLLVLNLRTLKNQPQKVISTTFSFLGLRPHIKDNFEIYNSNSSDIFSTINYVIELLRRTYLHNVSTYLKRKLGVSEWQILKMIHKLNSVPSNRPPLRDEVKSQMQDYFRDDRELLRNMINKYNINSI